VPADRVLYVMTASLGDTLAGARKTALKVCWLRVAFLDVLFQHVVCDAKL